MVEKSMVLPLVHCNEPSAACSSHMYGAADLSSESEVEGCTDEKIPNLMIIVWLWEVDCKCSLIRASMKMVNTIAYINQWHI